MSTWTPFKKLKMLCLVGVTEEQQEFHAIAPSMQYITIDGKRYFRCPQSRCYVPGTGEEAAMYLWCDYGKRKLAELEAKATP